MKNFFSQVDTALVQWGSDQIKVDLLNDVKQYINTGVCIQYRGKMKYLQWLWGRSSGEVAEILGVSDNTVRIATSRMSKELYEQFGHNFCELVGTKPQVARGKFEIVKNYRSLDTMFVPGFAHLLPVAPTHNDSVDVTDRCKEIRNSVEIKDCVEEIRFLKQFTQKGVGEVLNGLDQDRLWYVLDLLGDVNGGRDRFMLIRTLLK